MYTKLRDQKELDVAVVRANLKRKHVEEETKSRLRHRINSSGLYSATYGTDQPDNIGEVVTEIGEGSAIPSMNSLAAHLFLS